MTRWARHATLAGMAVVACTGGVPVPSTTTPPVVIPVLGPAPPTSDVWVATASGVGVVDGATGVFAPLADAGMDVSGVAVGDGAVWLASFDRRTVVPVDPRTGEVGEPLVLAEVSGNPDSIAYGHGSLWVSQPERRRVVRIDPASGAVLAEIPTGHVAGPIATTAEAVWVLSGSTDRVARIDPATNEAADLEIPEATPRVFDIAAGDAGLWVLYRREPDMLAAVAEIDPATGAFGPAHPAPDEQAEFLAVAGGLVWAFDGSHGTAAAMDPDTGEVVGTVEVGGPYPFDAAATPGALWVLEFFTGSVVRIDPATLRALGRVAVGALPAAIDAAA